MKRLLIPVFVFVMAALFTVSCQKELSQESNTNNASFSLLNDSTSECLGEPSVNGDYYNGVTATLSGNFVTVVVNVKSTGNYVISTGTENGFSFYDSGFFSKVGQDTLVLLPRGKPILIEATAFSFGDSTCPFIVDVQDSTGTGLGGVDTSGSGSGSAGYVDPNPATDGNWHFTDSTNNKTYSGTIPSATFQSAFGLNVLSGGGTQSSNASELFQFVINLPDATIPQSGSYEADFVTSFLTLTNSGANPPTIDYSTDGSAPQEAADPSYINITSYDASSKRLKISFRCWASDANGNPALIKGSLNTTVQ